MNNTIMRQVAVTAEYQPLAPGRLVGSVTISAPPTNTADVEFKSDDPELPGVPWQPGQWHEFRSIDLASVQVKGTPGNVIQIVGGTW